MRETLTVWNPFADEMLALWLETCDGGGAAGFAVLTVTAPRWPSDRLVLRTS